VALVWGATMPAIYWLSEVMGLQKNTETNTGPVGVVKK